LKSFATFSTGQEIATPRFFRGEQQALAKAHRRLSTEDKGTPERAKRRRVVARVQERIAARRGDFAPQRRRRIVNPFDLLAVADWSVNRMTHNQCLANRIHDVAWSQFADLLSYKAAGAGRSYVAVNPAYTSQDCSRCGHRQSLSLSDRLSTCPCCGGVLDSDLNARRNILAMERHGLASAWLRPGFGLASAWLRPGFGLEAPGFIWESCHLSIHVGKERVQSQLRTDARRLLLTHVIVDDCAASGDGGDGGVVPKRPGRS
jgi:IS605 OrfB family transposase